MKHNHLDRGVFQKLQQWLSHLSQNPRLASEVSENLSKKLVEIANSDVNTALQLLNTNLEGLSINQSQIRLAKYGFNEIAREKTPKWYIQLFKTFQNPLVILLLSLAIISLVTGDMKAAVIIIL
jgi:P-type Mg2+ transporter